MKWQARENEIAKLLLGLCRRRLSPPDDAMISRVADQIRSTNTTRLPMLEAAKLLAAPDRKAAELLREHVRERSVAARDVQRVVRSLCLQSWGEVALEQWKAPIEREIGAFLGAVEGVVSATEKEAAAARAARAIVQLDGDRLLTDDELIRTYLLTLDVLDNPEAHGLRPVYLGGTRRDTRRWALSNCETALKSVGAT